VTAIPGEEESFGDIYGGVWFAGILAGLQDFLNVIGHALADAGEFHELVTVSGNLLDGLRQTIEELRAALVAAEAANHGAVNFE